MKSIRRSVSFFLFISTLLLSCSGQVADPNNKEMILKDVDSKHDTVRTYYESGEIEIEALYLNGKQHGITRTYFKSGDLESEVSYKNGTRIGEGYIYREDGGIKEYYYYDHLGRLMYKAFYDDKGVLKNDRGNGFVSVFLSDTLIEAKDVFEMNLVCASPPNTLSTLKIFEYKYDLLIDQNMYATIEDTVKMNKVYDSEGSYIWKASLSICSKETMDTIGVYYYNIKVQVNN